VNDLPQLIINSFVKTVAITTSKSNHHVTNVNAASLYRFDVPQGFDVGFIYPNKFLRRNELFNPAPDSTSPVLSIEPLVELEGI
jgi:hypothetical protein